MGTTYKFGGIHTTLEELDVGVSEHPCQCVRIPILRDYISRCWNVGIDLHTITKNVSSPCVHAVLSLMRNGEPLAVARRNASHSSSTAPGHSARCTFTTTSISCASLGPHMRAANTAT